MHVCVCFCCNLALFHYFISYLFLLPISACSLPFMLCSILTGGRLGLALTLLLSDHSISSIMVFEWYIGIKASTQVTHVQLGLCTVCQHTHEFFSMYLVHKCCIIFITTRHYIKSTVHSHCMMCVTTCHHIKSSVHTHCMMCVTTCHYIKSFVHTHCMMFITILLFACVKDNTD